MTCLFDITFALGKSRKKKIQPTWFENGEYNQILRLDLIAYPGSKI